METKPPAGDCYSREEQEILLRIARRSLADRAAGVETVLDEAAMPGKLLEARGCFVTLFNAGELRGCVGNVFPKLKLFAAVAQNARAAGFHDPRFEPVSPTAIGDLEIEISVLSSLQPVSCASPEAVLGALRPGMDGVLLQSGEQMATFLPQVWNTLPNREEFLSRLCQKAGWPPDAWKQPGISISSYQAVSFTDKPENEKRHLSK